MVSRLFLPRFAVDHSLTSASRALRSRLESLDLGRNKLQFVTGVHHLTSLSSLILGQSRLTSFSLSSSQAMLTFAHRFADDNQLQNFDPSHELSKLRSLKLSKNRLTRLDAGQFPQLRTLYADNNRLRTINCSSRRTKLERLSLRSQDGGEL